MKLRLLSAVCLTITLVAPLAQAHVRLRSPTARYPSPDQWEVPEPEDGQQLKESPCGVTGDARTTDMTRITVFEPGQTIMVEFTETINHLGFFRISFDNDGQDSFVAPTSMADVVDPPVLPVLEDNIPDGVAGQSIVEVTLPNVECENCTLQLLQVMIDAGETTWTIDNLYHQCADIAIRASAGAGGTGGTGGAGGSGTGGAGSGGTLGAGGTAGAAGTAGGAGTPTSGGSGGAGGAAAGSGGHGNVPLAVAPTPEKGGCSLQGKSSRSGSAALLLLGLLGALTRRRRR